MMIWLLSALGWAKTALSWLRRLMAAYPLQCALIASLVACGWLWMGKRDALAERDAARAQIVTITKAQKEAERLAKQARAQTERISKELAHATNEQARSLDADSRRGLDAIRVRSKAHCRAASATPAPAMHDNSEGVAGTDPGGVYFTDAEADALRRHEVRSTVCEGWARGLINAGMGVAK